MATETGTKQPQPPTPVLDAMLKVAPDSQKIGDFLDWLSEQGIQLAKWGKDEYDEDVLIPIHEGPSALLHRYFNIDAKEEERERRRLLAWVADPYGYFGDLAALDAKDGA